MARSRLLFRPKEAGFGRLSRLPLAEAGFCSGQRKPALAGVSRLLLAEAGFFFRPKEAGVSRRKPASFGQAGFLLRSSLLLRPTGNLLQGAACCSVLLQGALQGSVPFKVQLAAPSYSKEPFRAPSPSRSNLLLRPTVRGSLLPRPPSRQQLAAAVLLEGAGQSRLTPAPSGQRSRLTPAEPALAWKEPAYTG